jgi:hypothetical protein
MGNKEKQERGNREGIEKVGKGDSKKMNMTASKANNAFLG